MKLKRIPLMAGCVFVVAWAGTAALATGRGEGEALSCGHAAMLAPADAAVTRQYAPSREIDILHVALEVVPDFRRRTISATATVRFKPIARPFQELRLDAVDLSITNLTATERLAGWQVTRDQVVVTFAEPIPPDREARVTFGYHAQPTEGLYFRTREMGYRAEDEHLWTQGEAIHARHWYPCFDAPNEKFTSEVTCHVPEGMVVLSNGRKVSEENLGGQIQVRWLQDQPHVNYLIALVAGYFKKIEDRHRDVPLAFWTVPSDFAEAPHSFAGTREMMAFFEREIGVPYPWARYDQVCVQDFIVGGMENTSLTTLRSETLFTKEFENTRSSQGLVAHELAHQWFGDLVTCKDWSHVWLNEGFATYYEMLYDEHRNGRDQLIYRLWSSAKTIVGQTNDTRPMVFRGYGSPNELFDWRAYGKGAWVLHMLRSRLGPDLFRRAIRTFVERHRFAHAVTEDLNAVIEEVSGRSFDPFFDQWVYHACQPDLDVEYAWDERSKQARVTVRQVQPVSDRVLLFSFPLPIRFKSRSGVTDREVLVKQRSEDFYFTLSQAPEIVRIDPELTVLARVNFKPPAAMLFAQLADRSDVAGRLMAIEQLQSRQDAETVARLKERLNGDPFYGVRLEASRALRAIHTEAAWDALLASLQQSDARVRRQVVADIGGFFREPAYAALLRVLQEEKNPDVVAEAVSALDAWARPEAREVLLRYLRTPGYRSHLAAAAIKAMRAQDDPAYIAPLREALEQRAADFSSATFAAGLDALAWLSRTQPDKGPVREFLIGQTRQLKQSVRTAALTALGTLDDPRALPVLDTFACASKDSPERKAAEKAIEAIRAARKPGPELSDLRKELLELQKEARDLRRELDTLKKKLEAAPPAPAPKRGR